MLSQNFRGRQTSSSRNFQKQFKFSGKPKRPLANFFRTVILRAKMFLRSFCDTPLYGNIVHQNFRTRQMGSAEFELFSACFFFQRSFLFHHEVRSFNDESNDASYSSWLFLAGKKIEICSLFGRSSVPALLRNLKISFKMFQALSLSLECQFDCCRE